MSCSFSGTFSQQQETTCWTWWGVSAHCALSRDATLRQHSSIVPQRLQSHLKYLFDWLGLPTSQTSQPHHLEPAYPSLPTSSRRRKIRWSLDHNYLIISDGSGEADNEEEAHGGCFQPDIQETGVLTVNGWLWYKENIISKEKPAL